MNNSEYQDIIETLEGILSTQNKMLERLKEINNTIGEINDYISSEKLMNDAVTSMTERHLSSTMYGVDNEQ